MDRDLSLLKRNMIIYISEGVAITAVNIPLVLIILLIQQLRTRKEFMFIAGIAIGDLIYTVGFTIVSILRFIELENHEGDMMTTRTECVKNVAIMLYSIGDGIVGEMVLFVSIDRLLAIAFPIWHFKRQIWYPLTMCSIPLLIAIVIMLANKYVVMTYDSKDLVFALCFDYTYPDLKLLLTAHRCGCVILSALVYVIVSFLLCKKTAERPHAHPPNLNFMQRKNAVHATITMCLSTLNAIVLIVIPDILLYCRVYTAQAMYLLLNSLVLNKIMVNFALFLARHREFRREFCTIVRAKKRKSMISVQQGWGA